MPHVQTRQCVRFSADALSLFFLGLVLLKFSLFQRLPGGLDNLSTECRESLSEVRALQEVWPDDTRIFGTEVHVG